MTSPTRFYYVTQIMLYMWPCHQSLLKLKIEAEMWFNPTLSIFHKLNWNIHIHFRAVVVVFRPLKIHQCYWTYETRTSQKKSLSNRYHTICGESQNIYIKTKPKCKKRWKLRSAIKQLLKIMPPAIDMYICIEMCDIYFIMIIFSVMVLSSWIFAFLSWNECFDFLNLELREGESQFNPPFPPSTPFPLNPGQREKIKKIYGDL